MMKRILFYIVLVMPYLVASQKVINNYKQKTINTSKSTLRIDSVSISPFHFKLLDEDKREVDVSKYTIDFAKSLLTIKDSTYLNKELLVEYEALPDFLTKTYQITDRKLIVASSTDLSKLFSPNQASRKNTFRPFDGLDTNGSLSRGITLGNNQDGVLNSDFNLQIEGNLNHKVKLKASITDNNLPVQDNGYTQRLNEFDRVFIELYSKKWRVTAGDIFLKEQENKFLQFNKKVVGVSVDAKITNSEDKELTIFASGALVEGKFTIVDFKGIESNQGPYRLANNQTPFLLIISNSETVYVDGIPLQRGEDNDYIIDYNTGEIIFNTTYPINSTMRIHVEFQTSNTNYTRFVTYDNINYKSDKLTLQVGFYNENDAKNKTLQYDFNDSQLQTLANAGDDITQMNALSAIAEAYVENKIQYKKMMQDTVETFVFSTDETEELYSVRFLFIGNNQGNYILSTTIATGRIYEYIAPINGILQGDYTPNIRLTAPNKLQITNIKATYAPNDKTYVDTNLAFSNLDNNLFSNIDDGDNNGFAGKLTWNQVFLDKKWQLASSFDYEMIQQNFNTIERINAIEFNRDWNLDAPIGDQNKLKAKLIYKNPTKGDVTYQFEQLNFGNFKGSKHSVNSNLQFDNTKINTNTSLLLSDTQLEKTEYIRNNIDVKQKIKSFWIGAKLESEDNVRKDFFNNQLTENSHKFIDYNTYFTVGDSSKVNLEIGYSFRRNDSLQISELKEVSRSNSYYIKTKIAQSKTQLISLFLNYRKLINKNFQIDKSLNSRLLYKQQLAKNLINLNTIYETSSGLLPQQEFNYVAVDPGRGFYTWIDFNENGIQEIDEFEIAQFTDQAAYVRVLLPSNKFIKTNNTKFSQAIHINPANWKNKKNIRKLFSYFANQSVLYIETKNLKEADFQWNPFKTKNALSINYNLKNSLYFNRGKQHYSTTYNYLKSINRVNYATGLQENTISSNQLSFKHKFAILWLLDIYTSFANTRTTNETFASRNIDLETADLFGKIAYSFSKKAVFGLHYNYKNKINTIGNEEKLLSHKLGASFKYTKNNNLSLQTSIDFIKNEFNGNSNSPVAYQILEGLQNGSNYTWDLVLIKKLNASLDINLQYNARKSSDFKAIHTGTIQLRASF